MNEFASLLRKYRESAGYTSARGFYKGLGGRPFFGCTYKQYLNVESGHSSPQPYLVERVATGLRVAVDESRAREYVLAYLNTLIGKPELVGLIVGAISGKGHGPGPTSPLRQAIKRSYTDRSEPLSRAQSELICKSKVNYWAFTIVANDEGSWSPEALAKHLGFREPEVKHALTDLVKIGLLSKGKEGLYACPKAGRVFLHPRDELYVPKVIAALRNHWESMASLRGGTLLHQHLFTRASESALRNYFPYLAQGVQGADIYSTHEKTPDSSFFLVETMVRRILPF